MTQTKQNDFKLTFTLKQHTPIIHFQYDQKGATLRATELKPKLDRFLIEKVGLHDKDAKPKDEFQSWFLAGQDGALDYKVRIKYFEKNTIDYPKPYVKKGSQGYVAPYFADSKSIEHNNEIILEILSFNRKILDAIKKNIKLFFSLNNFGARQSKGFGSYHIRDLKKNDFENLLKTDGRKVFRVTKNTNNPKEALKIIDTVYKEMKSGINYPSYKKSLLFQYMCTKDKGWEKKWLKQNFPSIVYGTHKPVNCKPPKKFFYIRALLGLAELNEYYPKGQQNKLQIKIEGVKKEPNTNPPKPYVQRFKSPITFKVFENNIYITYDKSYEKIFGEKFAFTLNDASKEISVPTEFDLYKFLQFVEKANLISEVK